MRVIEHTLPVRHLEDIGRIGEEGVLLVWGVERKAQVDPYGSFRELVASRLYLYLNLYIYTYI